MQKVAVELEQQAGLLLYDTEAPEEFATPDNWQTCADDLNSTLAGYNPPPEPVQLLFVLWLNVLAVTIRLRQSAAFDCSLWI